nr:hypothetical protein [Acidaminococcus fermentans]
MFRFLMHPGLFGQFLLMVLTVLFPEPVISLGRFLQQPLGSVLFVRRDSGTCKVIFQMAVDAKQGIGNGMELPGLEMESTDQLLPLNNGTKAPAAFVVNQDFPQPLGKGKQPDFQRIGNQQIVPLYLTMESQRMAYAIHMLFVFFIKNRCALVRMAPFAGPVSLCQGFLFRIKKSCMIFLYMAAKGALLPMVYFTGPPLPVAVDQHLFHLFSSIPSIAKEMGEIWDGKGERQQEPPVILPRT